MAFTPLEARARCVRTLLQPLIILHTRVVRGEIIHLQHVPPRVPQARTTPGAVVPAMGRVPLVPRVQALGTTTLGAVVSVGG